MTKFASMLEAVTMTGGRESVRLSEAGAKLLNKSADVHPCPVHSVPECVAQLTIGIAVGAGGTTQLSSESQTRMAPSFENLPNEDHHSRICHVCPVGLNPGCASSNYAISRL
jgi:hypothetical protein